MDPPQKIYENTPLYVNIWVYKVYFFVFILHNAINAIVSTSYNQISFHHSFKTIPFILNQRVIMFTTTRLILSTGLYRRCDTTIPLNVDVCCTQFFCFFVCYRVWRNVCEKIIQNDACIKCVRNMCRRVLGNDAL